MSARFSRAAQPYFAAHSEVCGRATTGWALDEQTGGEATDSEAGFEFGLAVILDGLRARLAAQVVGAVRA